MKKKRIGIFGALLAIAILAGTAQAAVIAYDEFVTDATAVPTNGIYDTGQDLGGAANAAVTGGTIVGFGTNEWTASAFYDAYAQKVRLVGRTQTSAAWADRALSASMVGKTSAYASLVLRLGGPGEASAMVLAGFSDSTMNSIKGASVGYKWDGSNWDMVLRYRNAGGAVFSTIQEDVSTGVYNTFSWSMDQDTDTIKVWVNENDCGVAADLTVTNWVGTVSDISHFASYFYSTGSGNDALMDDIQLGDEAGDIGMIPEPLPPGLLVREEFNTSSTTPDYTNGVYQSGGDLGDAGNSTCSGGTILGYDASTAWTDSSFIEAYAGLMRLVKRAYGGTYSGREIKSSMIGKTEVYAKTSMSIRTGEGGSAAAGACFACVGFCASSSLGSSGGSAVGFYWDGLEWDLALRYNSGSVGYTTIKDGVDYNTIYDIYWSMNDATDTIEVWVDENNANVAATLTVTDWAGTVSDISYVSAGHAETGTSDVYVYDMLLGDTLDSVGMVEEVMPSVLTILSLKSVGDDVWEIVVNTSNPSESYPKKTGTLDGAWASAEHSDSIGGPFSVTNLDVSAVDGSNNVIYVQSSANVGFFGIGPE